MTRAFITLIEHSIHLKQHTDMLRQHLLDFAQKFFSKNRVLKLFDVGHGNFDFWSICSAGCAASLLTLEDDHCERFSKAWVEEKFEEKCACAACTLKSKEFLIEVKGTR